MKKHLLLALSLTLFTALFMGTSLTAYADAATDDSTRVSSYYGTEGVYHASTATLEFTCMDGYAGVATVGIGEKFMTSTENIELCRKNVEKIVVGENIQVLDCAAFERFEKLKTVELPSTLTTVGTAAFSRCTALEEISIPDQVTTMGFGVFGGCTSLKQAHLPESLTTIDVSTFNNCVSLESITIPAGIEEIPDNTFKACEKLSSVTFAEGAKVEAIGEWSFAGCNALESISLPEGVKVIGIYAFLDTGLTSMDIPSSCVHIDREAFSYCTNLKSVNIPGSVLLIDSQAFEECSNLETVTLAEGIQGINEKAFYNDYNLKNIVLPETITVIAKGAFYNTGIESINFPVSLDYLDSGLFSNCHQLKEVTIPNTIDTLGDYVFSQCTNLEKIVVSDSVVGVGKDLFTDCSKLKDVYYTGTEEDWKDIEGIDKAGFPTDATYHWEYSPGVIWEYSAADNTLTFSGEGTISKELVDMTDVRTSVENIVIECGVTGIGAEAFANCTALKSVALPGCLERIGSKAFENCSALETITFTCPQEEWENSVEVAEDSALPADKMTFGEHEGVSAVLEQATCTEDGEEAIVCEYCGTVLQEAITIPARGHMWTSWVETKAPTATEKGIEERHCMYCGEIETRETNAEIEMLNITLEAPTCGTEVKLGEDGAANVEPAATLDEQAGVSITGKYWYDVNGTNQHFEGTFKAGTEYFAVVEILKSQDYTFSQDVTITANGKELSVSDYEPISVASYHDGYRLYLSTTAVHEFADVTYTWSSDNATCTAKSTCSKCGEEVTETVKATSAVTTQPTKTKAGVTTYTATFENTAFEEQTTTVAIPSLNDQATAVGTVNTVKGFKYKVLTKATAKKAGTVALITAKNAKSITVPATVKIGGKTFKVTQFNAKAFIGKKIRTVTLGKNVKTIKAKAFKGSKATKLVVKTKLLKKATVKGSLKGSKVKTVKVKVGNKKVNKKFVKKYKKIFTKKVAGKKVTVK